MAKKKDYEYVGICLPLVYITILLTLIGIIMVFSATYNTTLLSKDSNGDYLKPILMQMGVAVVGIAAMFAIAKLDYGIFKNRLCLGIAWGVCVVLLVWAWFSRPLNNAHRWIHITKTFSIQPSEFAKFLAVICAARYVSFREKWYTKAVGWLALFVGSGVIAGLILVEPDLSTTLCLVGSIIVVLFVAGLPKRIVVGGIICAGLLVPLMVLITEYQGDRIKAWLHAWEGDNPQEIGYQIVQSLYAIGDGGLFGVGLGNSKQKITHLPMSETDYIFSIICEEFGFIGALVVIALYVAYAYFGIKIAMEACDKFGAYTATGITTLIILQAIINMCVATNVIPSTGLTLPFISKGASSLGVMLCATGLLLSISARKKITKPKE